MQLPVVLQQGGYLGAPLAFELFYLSSKLIACNLRLKLTFRLSRFSIDLSQSILEFQTSIVEVNGSQ